MKLVKKTHFRFSDFSSTTLCSRMNYEVRTWLNGEPMFYSTLGGSYCHTDIVPMLFRRYHGFVKFHGEEGFSLWEYDSFVRQGTADEEVELKRKFRNLFDVEKER